jgi:hypothetical protein
LIQESRFILSSSAPSFLATCTIFFLYAKTWSMALGSCALGSEPLHGKNSGIYYTCCSQNWAPFVHIYNPVLARHSWLTFLLTAHAHFSSLEFSGNTSLINHLHSSLCLRIYSSNLN